MPDEELPAALAANLHGAFERLVLTYQHRLYAFALRLAGRPEDAEEIAQDAFVRAFRALSDYPAERVRALALRPWLFQITLNVFRNRMRGQSVHLVPLDVDDEEAHVMEPAADEREQPEWLAEHAERSRELAGLITALPLRYRAAVILRHVEGLGYREIASVLEQPVGTVKANVHRGIGMLREALARQMSEVR